MSYASVWTAATWREVCMIHAGGWSLILCRNVAFTYFNEAVQREVLSRIIGRLRAGEFLVIGRHERLPRGDPPCGEPPRQCLRPCERKRPAGYKTPLPS
jgi:hypothetical protein